MFRTQLTLRDLPLLLLRRVVAVYSTSSRPSTGPSPEAATQLLLLLWFNLIISTTTSTSHVEVKGYLLVQIFFLYPLLRPANYYQVLFILFFICSAY